MANTEYFYEGSKNSFDPTYGISDKYGGNFLGFSYRAGAGSFGFPSNPLNANQLANVSEKINTGAKVIEVSGLGIQGGGSMTHLDSIPKQHLEEINRLRKLTGVELSFHGPLVEATGISREGWKEEDRKEVERQMISAVKRAHKLDPDGNIVVTFHASNGLPEPMTKIIDDNGKEKITSFMIVDEDEQKFQNVASKFDYFENKEASPQEAIKKRNEDEWFRALQHINFNVSQGSGIIEKVVEASMANIKSEDQKEINKVKNNLLNSYSKFVKGKEDEAMNLLTPEEKKIFTKERLTQLTHGDIYLRESYGGFQDLFNKAYTAAKKNPDGKDDVKKLEQLRDKIAPKINGLKDDPSKVLELGEVLIDGVNVLRSINTPQSWKPMREWAIDTAGKSFGNTAFEAYKEFKGGAPIISIENPPHGMGLSTGEDLKELVKSAQNNFVQRAKKEFNMNESEAKKYAEKLIGVTWDVGHINMMRGKGYDEKKLLEETKKIKPFLKHIHLSDNFGLDHTELPMGMGNVPIKKMMDLLEGYNNKIKKIVETGNWYSQSGLNQKQTPVMQTFQAFGSPIYSMRMGAYWNQTAAMTQGYFIGQGATNPAVHHSIYGSGFSGLPVELGGQMSGQSRASGTPMS